MGETLVSKTFAVSDVDVATQPLPELPYHEAVAHFLCGPVESCSKYHGRLVANVDSHPLIDALGTAFMTHRPIILSPDIIWLTITQGLAIHVNQNAESLRHHFVSHEGQLKLKVRRDDFIKGSPENPWPEVFAAFSEQIHGHIGDAYDLIVADFSTTGPVERAASEVVLLDSMQRYFQWELVSECGIPSITLEGTADDWRSIAIRAEKLSRYGLDWWIEPLLPVLSQFVSAAQGDVDRAFWQSFFKYHSLSGGDCISGWVSTLFPYLGVKPRTHKRNRWLNSPQSEHGPKRQYMPNTSAIAPFKWKIGIPPHEKTYDMEFIGGLIGVAQNQDTLALRPEIGWAVCECADKTTRESDPPEEDSHPFFSAFTTRHNRND